MHAPADLFAPYDPDKFRVCGECLAACPVMDIDLEEAKEAMETMRRGEHVSWIDRRCQTCLACNLTCQQGANPAQLILARFAETMAMEGPRKWGRHFQQQQTVNFRSDAAAALPAEDKALLESWRNESPAEEITYPGCNFCNTAWLARSRMLAGHEIRGGFDLCCGEPFFRTGMESELRQCAGRLNRWLGRLGVKRMTVMCTAGTCLFRYVLPRYGLTHKMEVRSYIDLLYEEFRAGRHTVVKPVTRTVTVQESCYGKVLGPAYMDKVRDLLALIGCRVVEMKHRRETSLCCGIGAGFPPTVGYHPLALMTGAARVWREAGATGAERLVTYCSGCLLMLSSMGYFYPTNIGAVHLFALLAEAIGETLDDPLGKVRRSLVAGTMRRQFPRLLDFGRAPLEPFEK
ncbi:MAG: (Fe-S)-binding protein [Alphaproteobacteria bacterium]